MKTGELYQTIKQATGTNQVVIVDRPLGSGRMEYTKQALEDQNYTVETWYPANGSEAPKECEAVIVSEPDRMYGSQIDAFHEFMKQTTQKIVLLPSRSRNSMYTDYSVNENSFWKWAASRFPII